jgi:hypothetical protein
MCSPSRPLSCDLAALCDQYTKWSSFLCSVNSTHPFHPSWHQICSSPLPSRYYSIMCAILILTSLCLQKLPYHGTGTQWGWRKAVRRLLKSFRDSFRLKVWTERNISESDKVLWQDIYQEFFNLDYLNLKMQIQRFSETSASGSQHIVTSQQFRLFTWYCCEDSKYAEIWNSIL